MVVKKRQIGEARCRGEGEHSASWPRSSCVAVSIDLRKNVSFLCSALLAVASSCGSGLRCRSVKDVRRRCTGSGNII
jgi:hypothetical protein